MREKTPRLLRLFDIKLRLALGIKIDFDSDIAQTKPPIVKECYICLIKLAELWNTFEALVKYAKTKYKFGDKFEILETMSLRGAEPRGIFSGDLFQRRLVR